MSLSPSHQEEEGGGGWGETEEKKVACMGKLWRQDRDLRFHFISALAGTPPRLRDTYGESFYLFLGYRKLGGDSW